MMPNLAKTAVTTSLLITSLLVSLFTAQAANAQSTDDFYPGSQCKAYHGSHSPLTRVHLSGLMNTDARRTLVVECPLQTRYFGSAGTGDFKDMNIEAIDNHGSRNIRCILRVSDYVSGQYTSVHVGVKATQGSSSKPQRLDLYDSTTGGDVGFGDVGSVTCIIPPRDSGRMSGIASYTVWRAER